MNTILIAAAITLALYLLVTFIRVKYSKRIRVTLAVAFLRNNTQRIETLLSLAQTAITSLDRETELTIDQLECIFDGYPSDEARIQAANLLFEDYVDGSKDAGALLVKLLLDEAVVLEDPMNVVVSYNEEGELVVQIERESTPSSEDETISD